MKNYLRSLSSATLVGILSFSMPSVAHGIANPVTSGSEKKLQFEVVSIHPSKPGANEGVSWATSADGYQTRNQSLRSTILMAYFPQGMSYWTDDRISGVPHWIDDLVDIDAKVSDGDRTAWQQQGMALQQKPMLCAMLQAMLADRLKLKVHRAASEISGYQLVIGKQGLKLHETPAGEPIPLQAQKISGGGAIIYNKTAEGTETKYFSTTLGALAAQLALTSGIPVVDKSGVTAKYDFTMRELNGERDPSVRWATAELGLRFVSVKTPTETLVIDHIERPSEN